MKKPPPETIALLHAVEVLGGQSATAKLMGVTQQAVQYWCKRGRVPPLQVRKLEWLSGVSRTSLRPDIYPPGE